MNIIWITIIIISILFGIFNGNSIEMANALLNVPSSSLELLLKIGGLIIFYNGLFKIAIDSGLIKTFSRLLKKPIKIIFPDIPNEHVANEYICCNIVANLLGLGVASTPMALLALNEMKKLNNNKSTLSRSMIVFTVLNIACFTVLPLTVLSIRETYKAKINIELLPFLIIVTFINTIIGIIVSNLVSRKKINE